MIPKLRSLLILVLLVSLFSGANAQSKAPLIKNKLININGVTQKGKLREINTADFAKYSNLTEAKRAREINVNSILRSAAHMSINDTIQLDLFEDAKYQAVIDKVSEDINGVLSVRGRLIGLQYAYCFITSYQGKSYITVDIPESGTEYSSNFNPSTKKMYLYEVDEKKLPAIDLGNDVIVPPTEEPLKESEKARLKKAAQKSTSDPATIDILVCYTPRAEEIANEHSSMIVKINQMLAKSQIVFDNNNTNVILNLVHSVKVEWNDTTIGGLHQVQDPNDGIMDEVPVLRDQYYADLVVHIYNRDTAVGESAGGQGFLLTNPSGTPAYGYCQVGVYGMNSCVHAHEMGHNMGAHHNKSQKSDPGPGLYDYSAGWRWIGNDGGRYCDVESYGSINQYPEHTIYHRVPYFSDPNIIYQGVSAGDPDSGDNARTIREIKHVIAAYREADVERPKSLTAFALINSITLEWEKNDANNPVMLVYSPNNTFGVPVNGKAYTVGEIITGGGRVIYRGANNLTYTYTNVELNDEDYYYYRAFSYNQNNFYSVPRNKTVTPYLEMPKSLNAIALDYSEIRLAWVKNNKNNNVIIVASTNNIFGVPSNSVCYEKGDIIPGGGEVIYKGEDTSCIDRFLLAQTTYYYRIFSFNSSYFYSNGKDAYATTAAIPTPKNFTATVGGNLEIELSWQKNDLYLSYVILVYSLNNTFGDPIAGKVYYPGDTVSGGGIVIYKGASSTSFKHTDLTNEETYYYRAYSSTAVNNSYSVGVSAHATACILMPKSITATAIGSYTIALEWEKNINNDFVMLVRSTNGTAFGVPYPGVSYSSSEYLPGGGKILYRGKNQDSFIDTALESGETYYYRIFSFNSSYIYSNGKDASATTRVAIPKNLTAVALNNSTIELQWKKNEKGNKVMLVASLDNTFGTPVNGETYYAGDYLSGGGKILYRGQSTCYMHIDLESGKTYHYRAFSYDENNYYSVSVSANATTNLVLQILMHQLSDLSISPNPVTDNLMIRGILEQTNASIYSIEGKLMQSEILNNKSCEINIAGLPRGVYILKLYNEEKTYVTRFVKQ